MFAKYVSYFKSIYNKRIGAKVYPILPTVNAVNNIIECPICFDQITKYSSIIRCNTDNCTAVYHRKCIDKWNECSKCIMCTNSIKQPYRIRARVKARHLLNNISILPHDQPRRRR